MCSCVNDSGEWNNGRMEEWNNGIMEERANVLRYFLLLVLSDLIIQGASSFRNNTYFFNFTSNRRIKF